MPVIPFYECGAAQSRACTRQALGEWLFVTLAQVSDLSLLGPPGDPDEGCRRCVFARSELIGASPESSAFSIRRLGDSGTCCRELRLGVELRQEPEVQHSLSRMGSKPASGGSFRGWPVVHGRSMQAMRLRPALAALYTLRLVRHSQCRQNGKRSEKMGVCRLWDGMKLRRSQIRRRRRPRDGARV